MPTAGLSSLNEYENKYENGMRKSETELQPVVDSWKLIFEYFRVSKSRLDGKDQIFWKL